ncbi:MAG: micrococcal nuclease [Actinomycetota bacterium]|jgi:endonuclease YncB( thermonuclease family)|nr:micrococcal nuclease [Actinomycetota bacterium]MDQ1666298.1 micrococcal nuclease [Actinomycetota bacterium]
MLRRGSIQARVSVVVAGALLLALAATPADAVAVRPALGQRATITKVADGDTVNVRLRSGRQARVRLIGIDTPEVYSGIECGGPQASRSLERLLPSGTPVRLVSDPTQDSVDRYGRLLRYVIKEAKNADVNRIQVRRGWAAVYVYNHNPFKRVTSYGAAQAEARAHNRGIWGLC